MKKIFRIALCLFLAVSLGGCGNGESVISGSSGSAPAAVAGNLYYLNEAENQIVSVPYQIEELDTDGKIMELIARQSDDPPEKSMRPILPSGIKISNYSVDGTTLTIDLEGNADKISPSRRTLMVGGLAKLFLQIDGLDKISLTLNGSALKNSQGEKIGALSLEDFVENAGKNINNYQSATVTLYFTDETGTKLLPEVRTIRYSSNEPEEWAIVEELIRGPEENGHYPILSTDTNVLNVTTQDGTCYVNFDSTAENPILSIRAEIPIYAITDSIVHTIGAIRQVQFSINGESNVLFRDSVNLSKPYTMKEDLIENT